MATKRTTKAKPAAKRAGRPSKYSAALVDNILDQLIDGKSLRTICSAKGMPDRITVIRWLDVHEEFATKYARAREAQADTMDELILDTANKATAANAAAARVKIDAYKWRASKLLPKRYGDKVQQEHTGPNGGPIQTVDLTKATDDDLDRLEAVLARIAVAGGGESGEASKRD